MELMFMLSKLGSELLLLLTWCGYGRASNRAGRSNMGRPLIQGMQACANWLQGAVVLVVAPGYTDAADMPWDWVDSRGDNGCC